MLWAFTGVNPFGNRMQNWMAQVESLARVPYDVYSSRDGSANAVAFSNLVSHWGEISAGSTPPIAQREMRG